LAGSKKSKKRKLIASRPSRNPSQNKGQSHSKIWLPHTRRRIVAARDAVRMSDGMVSQAELPGSLGVSRFFIQ